MMRAPSSPGAEPVPAFILRYFIGLEPLVLNPFAMAGRLAALEAAAAEGGADIFILRAPSLATDAEASHGDVERIASLHHVPAVALMAIADLESDRRRSQVEANAARLRRALDRGDTVETALHPDVLARMAEIKTALDGATASVALTTNTEGDA
ncbi:hypothetical protein [Xanthobacter oligotrophicus]|uniref:hypothetical protein n=1 Tax=Xanthobacter oligotrophicus TaxID=2607286 RepID=UPI0011F29D7C|nr:hypothetical protein [Xanthobacter oligotrophicus]MCG5235304.1 hypothetical protein [Xanthobacter oligotrophicus]